VDPVPDPQHCMIGWQFLFYLSGLLLCVKKSIVEHSDILGSTIFFRFVFWLGSLVIFLFKQLQSYFDLHLPHSNPSII
jgi:hypothetical protein